MKYKQWIYFEETKKCTKINIFKTYSKICRNIKMLQHEINLLLEKSKNCVPLK